MVLLFAMACASNEVSPPPTLEHVRDCRAYSEPSFRDYCVLSLSSRPGTVLSDCSGLEELEANCRLGWASSHPGDTSSSRSEHLAACGSDDDCALSVLDARPHPEISTQLAACRSETGRHAQDCTVHALQRWAAGRPSEASFAHVAAEVHFPSSVGEILGLVVNCQGVGDCSQAGGGARQSCVRASEVEIPARPGICDQAPP